MADEGISIIKQELQRKRPAPLARVNEVPDRHMKSNFNLSFNNSFNTNFTGKPNLTAAL
jgi:hypothetical protein